MPNYDIEFTAGCLDGMRFSIEAETEDDAMEQTLEWLRQSGRAVLDLEDEGNA